MRKWLNNYFDFTKSEFNGLLVLLFLIALVTAAPYAYALVVKDEFIEEDYRVVQRLILKNEEGTDSHQLADKPFQIKSRHSFKNNKVDFFYFDPNLINEDDWVRLGLSEKQANSILKYVKKGGQFKDVEDLKKMYTISPVKYLEIAPYVRISRAFENTVANKKLIQIPAPNERSTYERSTKPGNNSTVGPTNVYPKKTVTIVEINGADSTGLDEIRGIGPAFALRIINYRERIGGFVNKEQLMEVFGLDSLKYAEIKNQIRVDASAIRKININSATADNFQNHPYLRFKQINAIIQYRKQHGNYSNIADLAKVLVIPAETIVRLAPYLTF